MAADLEPDLFHVHEPELLAPVIKYAASRPVVYDVHESYLDVIMEREWIPRWLRPVAKCAWDRRERQLLRRCAAVVVVTECIARRYHRLHNKVQVVANYPDLTSTEDLSPLGRTPASCVFAGLITPDRGLSQVLIALAILKRRGLPIELWLAGNVAARYLQQLWGEAEDLGIRALVSYHGVLSQKEAMLFQQKAGIGLVTYLPVANSMASLPNKLVECMALGLPVVYSDFPNYREIAGTSGAGIPVDPVQPSDIAVAIEYLALNPEIAMQMGEAGRQAARERFNWRTEGTKLLQIYEEILASPDHLPVGVIAEHLNQTVGGVN